MENKKTLDETFICLKLAMLVRDAPLNIVEFFGASILPQYDGNNRLQLFLELMPGKHGHSGTKIRIHYHNITHFLFLQAAYRGTCISAALLAPRQLSTTPTNFSRLLTISTTY